MKLFAKFYGEILNCVVYGWVDEMLGWEYGEDEDEDEADGDEWLCIVWGVF